MKIQPLFETNRNDTHSRYHRFWAPPLAMSDNQYHADF
jgi:hypothetical protein